MATTDMLRDFLKENGFYSYLLEKKAVSKKFMRQYAQVSSPSNKRNLFLNANWKSINSFGPARRIAAIDLGGTNLSLFDIEVGKKGAGGKGVASDQASGIKIHKTRSCSFYRNITYTPDILFTDIKKELDGLIASSVARQNLKNLVFIFSYPIEQTGGKDGRIDAVCTKMVKEHREKGIVGLKIGSALHDYLRAHGYPAVRVSVTNDTPIHTFAAKAWEILHHDKYDAVINLIVGTGCNVGAAYDEKKRLHVINTEFGGFTGAPLSAFDKEYDKKSTNKNSYLNEKMISGAYQHEIFKIIVRGLLKNKIIGEDVMKGLEIDSLDSGGIEKLLNAQLAADEKYEPLRFVWREISKRGGTLCGIFLAGLMAELRKKNNKKKTRVAVMQTGSVLTRPGVFRDALMDTIDGELGGKGAAGGVDFAFRELPHQAAYGAVIFDLLSGRG